MKIYEPDGAVLSAFVADRSRVAIIQGPIGCLDADTEFLTPGGWKRIADYAAGDLVGEWEDGRLLFSEPRRYIDAPCSEMIHFRNDHGVDMMLTGNHRVPLVDARSGKFKVREASDVAASPGRYFVPINYAIGGPGVPMDEWALRLRVAITADGCFPKRGNQCVVTVRKSRKKRRLRMLLSAAGMEWKEHQHSTRDEEVTFAFAREGLRKGFEDLWSVTSDQARIIIEECLHWDGTRDPDERFYTTRKAEADFIQFCAHAVGRRATIGRHDSGNEKWAANYTVHLAREGSPKAKVGMRVDNIEINRVSVPRQYCFETMSGFFLARRNDKVFVTGNSGTSTGCIMRLYLHLCEQTPGPDGIRRSRWAVVRNTYPELEGTTIATWQEWFPENEFGPFRWKRPPTHYIRVGDVEAEIVFLALDSQDDIKKLRSSEWTGFFLNEMQYILKPILDEADSRVGRYPAKKDGGSNWVGIIGDMNAPDPGHYINYMRGDEPFPDWMTHEERKEFEVPDSWKFFVQPPAVLEKRENGRIVGYEVNRGQGPYDPAENLRWLRDDYYDNMLIGKSKAFIDTRMRNVTNVYVDGKVVWPDFRRDIHVASRRLQPIPDLPLIVGLDFGRQPAAVLFQSARGRIFVLSEIQAADASAEKFAPVVKSEIATRFPDHARNVQCWGDPSANWKTEVNEYTAFEIFLKHGLAVRAAPGNNVFRTRVEAVEQLLNRTVDGAPAFLVDPSCRALIAAMEGQYHFPRLKGTQNFRDEVAKNPASHVAEALQYGTLGAGYGRELVKGGARSAPVNTKRHRKAVFGRKSA